MLTLGETRDRLWTAWVACGCGRREQLDLLEMRKWDRVAWTEIFPRLKCTAPNCQERPTSLTVSRFVGGKPEVMLELFR